MRGWVRIGHAKRTPEFATWEMRLKKSFKKNNRRRGVSGECKSFDSPWVESSRCPFAFFGSFFYEPLPSQDGPPEKRNKERKKKTHFESGLYQQGHERGRAKSAAQSGIFFGFIPRGGNGNWVVFLTGEV